MRVKESETSTEEQIQDLFIIGGGINGCGIARDAAGRGLTVALAEMGDLGGATSSSSTKLFHGGLRYLEYFEFRLVKEALKEREVLLRAMPHISWPMRFVLPYSSDMRFEAGTPTSRLLGAFMPWMRGRRPAWLIRLGLFLYDHLGTREVLPGTSRLDLVKAVEGVPLTDRFKRAYEYSDCWVDDARLVVLNARDAERRGAKIMTRTKVISVERDGNLWSVQTKDQTTGAIRQFRARVIVNAAGPWVAEVIKDILHAKSEATIRLVRGSHIVVPKLYDHDKAYFFQGTDGRIIFSIPYEEDFTLIGTTDSDHFDPDAPPVCSEEEKAYLCDFASQYFKEKVAAEDVVWTYSGVRPLYDDGASSATSATREYVLQLLNADTPPILNVFGGKITTYRRLAEAALRKLETVVNVPLGPWTERAALPGGDFNVGDVQKEIEGLRASYPFLTASWARRLFRNYGTEVRSVLGSARNQEDLGIHFGATLFEQEVRWLMEHEFALCAEDIVWRRTKQGLRMSVEEIEHLDRWIESRRIGIEVAV